ncbi:hypothetical protein [Parasphingopyxis marina]|uniref:Uncharacterized protein n=1 Tax=Parasphingopyxis marina TaxID=2761622 RepID=A0A842HZG7_9SPHN|nr:hypothetical protein [Parasphingopyxis marina]MBC2778352.1 hypothetical protein [Parasphingopyxis marina]
MDGNDTDLFGNAPPQADLFASEERPGYEFRANPDRVRRRLNRFLAEARAARAMPWPEREARTIETIFPQMANWLPDDEADQLRFEFAQEIERLKKAA